MKQKIFLFNVMITMLILLLYASFANAQIGTQLIEVPDKPDQEAMSVEEAERIADAEIQRLLQEEGISPVPGDAAESEGEALPSNYTLGAKDVIEIAVLRHPEVSGKYTINNEGNIQYEFIGDIEIAGKTKDEAIAFIKEKLSEYIISPEVTLKILGYNSKVVYVIGEVGRPGKIYMQGDTITIREALIQAALPLLTAKGSKSKLITPSDDGKPKQIRVDIDKLLYEGDLRENLVMKPGDTLFVPPTGLAKVMRVLKPVAEPVGTASGIGRNVMTGF